MDKKYTSFVFAALPVMIIILAASFYLEPSIKDDPAPIDPTETQTKSSGLSSFFKNKADYDSAFLNAQNSEKKNVLAEITSHHFLARDLIARFFLGINNSDVQDIILIGPDHYRQLDNTSSDIAITELSWNTPYGEINANKDVEENILGLNGTIVNNSIFRNEHSIYTLVPFIKRSFPNTRLIPLIIHSSNDYEKFAGLGNSTRKLASKNSLLIVSSDFSHEASIPEAQKNDQISIETLENLNPGNIDSLTSDCKACIAFLYGFLKDDQSSFYLVENKNSSDFGSPEEKVTSYISGYFLNNER